MPQIGRHLWQVEMLCFDYKNKRVPEKNCLVRRNDKTKTSKIKFKKQQILGLN